jgi:glycosyltransferase involved in cell wall biosynthesis
MGLPQKVADAQPIVNLICNQEAANMILIWERLGVPPDETGADISNVSSLRCVWTLNDSQALSLKRQYPGLAVAVAPMAIPGRFFTDTTRRTLSDSGAIFMGRFTRSKGALHLARMWSETIYPRMGIKLTMAGLGLEGGCGDEQEVAALARKAPKAIQLRGILNANERIAHYRYSKMAIFPAEYDHCPQMMVEAMACGTPVLCSAIDGHRFAIHERTSLTFMSDLSDLPAIVEYASNRPRVLAELAKNAKHHVRQHCSEPAAVHRLEQLINESICRTPS